MTKRHPDRPNRAASACDLMHSGRRAFLIGTAGAAVALPLLEYTHGRAFATGAGPKRFLTFFEHGGTISNVYRGWPNGDGAWRASGRGEEQGFDYWAPLSDREPLELGPIHQGLEAWRSKLLVFTGVDNLAGVRQSQYADGGHGTANVTALTAADIRSAGDDAVSLGPSIDHIVAERLSAVQPVRFNRIHLRVSGHDYGGPYYRASGERARGEPDPRAAFASIFEGVTASGGPDPAYLDRQRRRRSVLDGVLEGFSRYRGRVSTHDLMTIDAHLEHLRALERELESLDAPPMCAPPEDIAGASAADVIGPLHVRIMVAALRCGLTNVANLEVSDIITPWVGGTDWGYEIGHSLHHYAREVGPSGPSSSRFDRWIAEMLANRQWRMSLVAQLLEGLDDPAFAEGGNTMLDNSLVLCASEFSNGAAHIAYNLPLLTAGSAGGYFRTGRHLNYDTAPGALEYQSRESTHNLFTSILHAFGGADEHFGSDHAAHRGPLPNLT